MEAWSLVVSIIALIVSIASAAFALGSNPRPYFTSGQFEMIVSAVDMQWYVIMHNRGRSSATDVQLYSVIDGHKNRELSVETVNPGEFIESARELTSRNRPEDAARRRLKRRSHFLLTWRGAPIDGWQYSKRFYPEQY